MLPESSRIAILEILLAAKAALEVPVELRLGGLLVGELVADRLQLFRFLQCEGQGGLERRGRVQLAGAALL